VCKSTATHALARVEQRREDGVGVRASHQRLQLAGAQEQERGEHALHRLDGPRQAEARLYHAVAQPVPGQVHDVLRHALRDAHLELLAAERQGILQEVGAAAQRGFVSSGDKKL
jgi:hypothetical protein